MKSEARNGECAGPNFRVLLLFLMIAGLATLIATALRAVLA
jgi:hypothetical protein